MNKLILGMALGACAGLLISEIPEVKKYLDKGKKKMQNIAKQCVANDSIRMMPVVQSLCACSIFALSAHNIAAFSPSIICADCAMAVNTVVYQCKNSAKVSMLLTMEFRL